VVNHISAFVHAISGLVGQILLIQNKKGTRRNGMFMDEGYPIYTGFWVIIMKVPDNLPGRVTI
jgi:hypothetical protein